MARGSEVVGYNPPRLGLPYLVITLTDGRVSAIMPVKWKDEAAKASMSAGVHRQEWESGLQDEDTSAWIVSSEVPV
jgi:hypothetical protein